MTPLPDNDALGITALQREAFAALALSALVHAASVTDAVGGAASAADGGASAEAEGGVWARVVRLLKGSAMAFSFTARTLGIGLALTHGISQGSKFGP